MARPSRFVHPFRRVRDIMGITQEGAAEALGISRSGLKQIETGMLPLSEEIATRMLLLTGAKIPTGFCRETVEPVAWDNSPYGTSSLHQWYRHVFSGEAVDTFHWILTQDLHAVVHAAGRMGRHLPLMWAVQTALADLARNFGVVELLADETLARFFGSLVDRAHANGIELEDAFKMATPPVKKSAESKKKEPETTEELARILQGKLEALQGRGEHTSSPFGRASDEKLEKPAKSSESKKSRRGQP